MINKVEVEGKVLSVWVSKKGGLIMKLAVTHIHGIYFSFVFNFLFQIPNIL